MYSESSTPMNKKNIFFITGLFIAQLLPLVLPAQAVLPTYNITWNSQSKHAGESMPCGGGDIGLNVWVEKGDLLLYMAKSGCFDENNALLKQGRIRVKLTPNVFDGEYFKQELKLAEGYIQIDARHNKQQTTIKVWVDVFRPVIHVDVSGNTAVKADVAYESWRYTDRKSTGKANNANSYKWAPPAPVITNKDNIAFDGNTVLFYHRNRPDVPNIFDVTVKQQGLDAVKDQLYNPIANLTFGGSLQGTNLQPAGTYTGTYMDTDFTGWKLESKKAARNHQITVFLFAAQTPSLEGWRTSLQQVIASAGKQSAAAWQQARNWWKQYWQRSFIYVQPNQADTSSALWQTGRNYQLFRYMLGCNAFGSYPTKFNGGLFTYDPSATDTSLRLTPDFRNWGGGIHTAQNQRLVYFPMLKSGDYDLMKPQLDFYLRLLRNAELRSEVYWHHKGACFAEQLENFGLPNSAEYGWKRPADYDKGLEYNAWLEYEWDTVLEFCLMMLETERYNGNNISEYIPFIESCLRFFDEHYQYLAGKRGRKTLDGNGDLILFPGSAAETYKMAYNPSSTVAGLRTVLTKLLELPASYLTDSARRQWQLMLSRIPPISFRQFGNYTTIAPARLWERINNTECPQLYPVFPWGIYGVGKPGLDTAVNTFKHDTDAIKFRSHVGWKQDNIFAARLGLTDEALQLTTRKLKNSGRRFPAFWGPGYDWTPDHNWGGSGMIGLQEMLLQTNGKKILLFPAWPNNQDVHFKLHAPYNTTVEASLVNGKLQSLIVTPAERKNDVVVLLKP
ncbi:DUF5703 domain-containing protein [Longitalea luteola]|uniref:DUF5703 domain-containing protein n=1 Tax=Longitalea luteola TaxID=2812563 RepID=UPI001F61D5EF|nr:DUF5703 domain-containing protein [Longitalea luteola]